MTSMLLAIPAIPLAVFTLFCLWRPRRGGDLLAILGMAASFALTVAVAVPVLTEESILRTPALPWISFGAGLGIPAFTLSLGMRLDPMGAVMLLVVTGLALAVLIYSTWYLHGDRDYTKYFGHFSFFAFAMMGIVLSDNLLMTFIFWELVGVGSYLLIGFWYYKPLVADDPFYQTMKAANATGINEKKLSPSYAQLKAFVMNRVGDFGFLAGLGLFAWVVLQSGIPGNPLSWDNVRLAVGCGAFDRVSFAGLSGSALLTLAGIFVFLGAIGKSAQFPLHTWLPDAMQGPTTGSAIIHAATMVAAGVFLTARLLPFLTPDALLFVSWIGAITAFIAATIALVQWDFKAVLAYSTISQLGYMMIGLGAGAATGGYSAGLSHLFTHALFKCLLFLGAASVIHGCGGHQDINRFGGLARKMPWTAAATGLAVLAICGLPFFSSFWSKDALIASAFLAAEQRSGLMNPVLAWGPWFLSVLTAALTCFYMTRQWSLTFLGKARDPEVTEHAHDPWLRAKVVLFVLSLFTFQFLWTGSLNPFGASSWLDGALRPLFPVDMVSEAMRHHAHVQTMELSVLMIALGMGSALFLYRKGPMKKSFGPLWNFFANLWFIDRLWDLLWVEGLGKRGGRGVAVLDLGTSARLAEVEGRQPWSLSIDGVVDGLAKILGGVGALLGRLQNSRAVAYAAYATLVLGLLALLLVL